MLTTWQALLLGALQGATELFPVSSLGHAVILPSLLHWDFRQSDPTFLPLLVLLHLGTATALFILYWQEWRRLVVAFVRASINGAIRTPDERLSMQLLAATVPTAIVFTFFQEPIQGLFANPRAAAGFLIVNGGILFGAELLRRRDERRIRLSGEGREREESGYADVHGLTFRAALLVGLCQILALFPGISRSGVTMAGGLLAGLRHQEAAHFSFLLATPIIAAAGIVKLPELVGRPGLPIGLYLASAVVAGLAAYISARFLINYFRVGRFDPYALYCAAFGVLSLILIR